MPRRPGRTFRPAMSLCDEYQTFATVGEDEPAGDEKVFCADAPVAPDPHRGHAVDLVARAVLGQSAA